MIGPSLQYRTGLLALLGFLSLALAAPAQISSRDTIYVSSPGIMSWRCSSNSSRIGAAIDLYIHNNRSTYSPHERYKITEVIHAQHTIQDIRPRYTDWQNPGKLKGVATTTTAYPFLPDPGDFDHIPESVSGSWRSGNLPPEDGKMFSIYRHSTVILWYSPDIPTATSWEPMDAVDLIVDLTVFAYRADGPTIDAYAPPTPIHLYLNGGPSEPECICDGDCAIGKPEPGLENGQASVGASLGTDDLGHSASLQVSLQPPDSSGFLSATAVAGTGKGAQTVKDADKKPVRIIGGQAVAQIVDANPSTPGLEIQMYHSTAEADTGTGAFATMQLSYAGNQVSVAETYLGATRSYSYSYDSASRQWSLRHEEQDQVTTVSANGDAATASTYEVLESVTTVPGEEVAKTRSKFTRTTLGISQLKEVVRDPDGRALSTLYEYNAKGQVSSEDPDDGPWKEYGYHATNRLLTKQRIQFGEAPRSAGDEAVQVITIDYNPPGSPTRLTIESLLGQEVRRVYRVNRPGGHDEILATVPGAAWNAASGLKTSYRYHADGEFYGELESVTRPDGTVSLYSYARDPVSKLITKVEETGQPHSTDPGVIVDGTRITTVTGEGGQVLTRVTQDVASGLTLSEETTLSQDAFGRPTRTQTLAGIESRSFGCCGLESFTDATGLTTLFTRNGPVRTESRQGITTTTTRAGRSTVVSRRGTDGSIVETSRTERNRAGDIIRWTDALGRETLRSEQIDDLSGYRTVTLTYPDGGTRIEVYFPDGRLQSVGGTAAYPKRYEYGVENNLRTTRIISLGDSGEELQWSKSFVDMAGRLVREEASHECGTPAATQYTYNEKGQLARVTDADGVTTLFAYNGKGERIAEAVDANGNHLIDADGSDRLVQWETVYAQRDGKTVRRVSRRELQTGGSDEATLVSMAEEAADGQDAWNTVGGITTRLATVLHGNGDSTITQVFPDGSRRVRQVTGGFLTAESLQDSAGAAVTRATFGYDAHGRLATETDARSGTIRYAYFDDDRLQSVTSPSPGDGGEAQVTSFSYDPNGRLDTVTLPDSGIVDRDYYLTGDLRRQSGARTWPVDYAYDSQGRLRTMSTAGGQTAWDYHPESGRLHRKTHGDGHGPVYTYTAAGRLDTRTNGRGTVTDCEYNILGDLVLVDHGDATPDIAYTHTRHGRLASITHGGRTHSYVWSPAGQLEAETATGGVLDGLLLVQVHDALRRRSGWRAAAPGWEVSTGYAYDAVSRLRSVSSRNREVRYAYVPDSNLLQTTAFLTRGAAVLQTSRAWDNLGRLQALSHQGAAAGPTGLSQSFSYAYNAANQRTRLTRNDGGFWDYEYDSLGQLTSGRERLADGTPRAGRQFEYELDAIGNRTAAWFGGDADGQNLQSRGYTSRTGDGTQIEGVTDPGLAVITGWAHPNATVKVGGNAVQTRQGGWFRHELGLSNAGGAVETLVQVDAILEGTAETDARKAFAPAAQAVFEYDDDGNLTFDGFLEYTWDANNRLTQVGTRSGLAPPGSVTRDFRQAMEYDHLGRRIRRALYYRIRGQEHLASDIACIYDGWSLVAEVDVLTGALLRSYVWGLDLSGTVGGAGGAGGLLSVTDARLGQTHYAVHDGNGNLTALADALSGAQTAAYHYDPFGNPLGIEGAFAARNPFRFSTKYFDEAPALYHYGFRDYAPGHGRWLSRDPLAEAGGANLYGFVGNEPVGWVDDWGAKRRKGFSTQQIDTAVNDLLSGKVPELSGTNPLTEQLDQARAAAHPILEGAELASSLGFPDPGDALLLAGIQGIKLLPKISKIDDLWRALHRALRKGDANVPPKDVDRLLDRPNACAHKSQPQSPYLDEIERQGLAQDYYRSAGWPDQKIAAHLRGIDFSKDVGVLTVPKGTKLVQYQIPGAPKGNYFAFEGTAGSSLGIYTGGRDQNIYEATTDVQALVSTAAKVVDDWSVPFWKVQTEGGGIQFFVLNNDAFVLVK